MAGRAGVAGRRCLVVAKDDRLKAGVSEVVAAFVEANKPGSEKRTRFDLRVEGVLAWMWLSDAARGLAGDERTVLVRLGLRRAIGISMLEGSTEAMSPKLMLQESLRETLNSCPAVTDKDWNKKPFSTVLSFSLPLNAGQVCSFAVVESLTADFQHESMQL